MPSEKGISVTNGASAGKRGRGPGRKFRSTALAALAKDRDDLYARYLAGNERLTDDDLARFCGITPAMVYQLREIAEGRVGPGAMATLEAFERMAKYGHAPAKGAAKPADPETAKTVIFQINVAEIRPEVAAAEPKVVIDIEAEKPALAEVPVVALTVTTDG